MVEAWSKNTFESGMDLGEQAANAVAGSSDLRAKIIVEVSQQVTGDSMPRTATSVACIRFFRARL